MIYLTGDCHGEFQKFYSEYLEFKEEDSIIQLGDFGGIFFPKDSKESQIENQNLNILNKYLKCPMYIVAGNHCNFPRIYEEFELCDINGISFYKIRENIRFLQNGQTFNIEGKIFLSIGGALSIDKDSRIDGLSWWKEEEMSFLKQMKLLVELQNTKYVDYVISHTAPISIIKKYLNVNTFCLKNDSTSKFLEEIKTRIEFKHWYFGHFHRDKRISDHFTVLYETFDKIT